MSGPDPDRDARIGSVRHHRVVVADAAGAGPVGIGPPADRATIGTRATRPDGRGPGGLSGRVAEDRPTPGRSGPIGVIEEKMK
jgi:hypothetical protein